MLDPVAVVRPGEFFQSKPDRFAGRCNRIFFNRMNGDLPAISMDIQNSGVQVFPGRVQTTGGFIHDDFNRPDPQLTGGHCTGKIVFFDAGGAV